MAALKLVTATVAHGKTVFVGAEKKTVWDADSKRDVDIVKATQPKGPGSKVSLPEDEVIRLRALGFLEKENAEVIDVGPGPSFSTNEGPQIKAA